MSKQNTLFLIAMSLFVGFNWAACAFAQDAATVEPTQSTERTEFASDDPDLKPMFTKDSFEGWVQLGGKSKYEIKDGVITGTCVPGEPNSFMATGVDYTDFEMEVEFKAHPAMNLSLIHI